MDDRIRGLRSGGDDYLVKPFAFGELLARLDVLMRRSQSQAVETVMSLGDLRSTCCAHRVTRAGKPVALQPREFKLLTYLLRHANQVVTRMPSDHRAVERHRKRLSGSKLEMPAICQPPRTPSSTPESEKSASLAEG